MSDEAAIAIDNLKGAVAFEKRNFPRDPTVCILHAIGDCLAKLNAKVDALRESPRVGAGADEALSRAESGE
jgi:hypothetical protein